jgi:two-component system response regulator LytT
MDILLIEDDIFWQTKMEKELYNIEPSWKTTSVNNLDKAKEYLSNTIPDIIIADVLIGNETIFNLFDNETYKNIPVVFMTASEDEMLYDHSKEYTDSIYLVKPFHKICLKSAIENTMLIYKRRLSRNAKGISVRGIHNEKIELKVHEIVAVESVKNYCIIKTSKNQYALKVSLSKILEDMKPTLIQIHKTYLVNKEFITKLNLSKQTVQTSIGVLPIGRKYKENILNYMIENRQEESFSPTINQGFLFT